MITSIVFFVNATSCRMWDLVNYSWYEAKNIEGITTKLFFFLNNTHTEEDSVWYFSY